MPSRRRCWPRFMSESVSSAAEANAEAIASLRREGSVVLGVVVEVPQPWAEDLQQWRLGFGDNTADHMPTHITLVPPTVVSSGRLDAVLADIDAACEGVAGFHIATSGISTFRPTSPVVYLAIGDGGKRLQQLHELVLPLVSDKPVLHPYVPHITVAMHLPDAVLDSAAQVLGDYSLSWDIASVCSFVRGRDGRWVKVKEHFLQG